MGLFGSAKKRDAALANPQMYMPATEAPPIPEAASIAPQGMGTFNLAPVGQIKPHVGAFDRGGMGWQVLGAIGDSLSQMGGYGSPFATARLLQQKQQLEDAQWTRRQESELAQRKAMYDYELAHPKPFNNDTIADYNFRVQTLGKQAADEWLRSQGDPIVTIPLPGDRIYSGPRSGLGAALGGAVQPPMPQAGAVVDDPRRTGGAGSTQRPFDAVIEQESGGRAGALGPQTPYGRAQGLSQMLPATAEEQARKLGIAWRPDLMTGTTPEAAAYQRQLGESYFNEGMQRTGNLRDALRYYHGGPNRRTWGRKTNAYADAVMARIGG